MPCSSNPRHPVLSSTSVYYHLTGQNPIKVTTESYINVIFGNDAKEIIVLVLEIALSEPPEFFNTFCRVGSEWWFPGSHRKETSALSRPVISAVQPMSICILGTNSSHFSHVVKEPLSYNSFPFPPWISHTLGALRKEVIQVWFFTSNFLSCNSMLGDHSHLPEKKFATQKTQAFQNLFCCINVYWIISSHCYFCDNLTFL